MSKKGFFNSLKNIFSSDKEQPVTIKDLADDSSTQKVETDFTQRKIATKSILPTEEKHRVFLKYDEPRKIPKGIDVKFVKNFSGKSGRFIYCETNQELIERLQEFLKQLEYKTVCVWEDYTRNWLTKHQFNSTLFQKNLEGSDVAISLCEGLVAEEGSLMFSSEQASRRTLNVFPKTHIVLAHSKQFKIDVEHGLEEYKFRYEDGLPFLFQLGENVKKYRFIDNKPLINAEGTKDVYVFFTDEPIVLE